MKKLITHTLILSFFLNHMGIVLTVVLIIASKLVHDYIDPFYDQAGTQCLSKKGAKDWMK